MSEEILILGNSSTHKHSITLDPEPAPVPTIIVPLKHIIIEYLTKHNLPIDSFYFDSVNLYV